MATCVFVDSIGSCIFIHSYTYLCVYIYKSEFVNIYVVLAGLCNLVGFIGKYEQLAVLCIIGRYVNEKSRTSHEQVQT